MRRHTAIASRRRFVMRADIGRFKISAKPQAVFCLCLFAASGKNNLSVHHSKLGANRVEHPLASLFAFKMKAQGWE